MLRAAVFALVSGCAAVPSADSWDAMRAEQRRSVQAACIKQLLHEQFRTRVEVVSHDPRRVCHAYAKRVVP